MSTSDQAIDWGGSRGERWRDQLAGMEAMLAPVDEPLLDALALSAPCRVVDVGCGGGGTTRKVYQRAPAGSVVHGRDVSPALVEAARSRVPPGAPGPSFEVADMATAAPDAPYDRMFSRFGVMFFGEPEAAFANLARWLAPGGRFAFAVWGRPADNVWMKVVRAAVASVVEVPAPLPDAPGPFRYGDNDTLLALLGDAGLGAIDVREWRGSLAMGGGLPPAEAASFAIASFAAFADLLAAKGDAAVAEGRRVLMERFAEHVADGVVRMGASVRIVTGARPR